MHTCFVLVVEPAGELPSPVGGLLEPLYSPLFSLNMFLAFLDQFLSDLTILVKKLLEAESWRKDYVILKPSRNI